ncbi:MAG: type II toxin-antitoxin system VapC family toxin [Thermoleophilia bacterium]
MDGERLTYLDASALVKLVVEEAESPDLRRHLAGARCVTSRIARVEVACVAARLLAGEGAARVRRELARCATVSIDRAAGDAERLGGLGLRALDTVHLATMALLGDALGESVVYDRRLAAAAAARGFAVVAPGLAPPS